MNDIKGVGRVGVGQVQCVGGPHDGESHWAVVGSAVVLMVPREEKPKRSSTSIWMSYSFGLASKDEDYKKKAKKEKVLMDAYAAYLPDMRDGKATGLVRFEGLFKVPRPIAPPKPTEDDDDEDDDE